MAAEERAEAMSMPRICDCCGEEFEEEFFCEKCSGEPEIVEREVPKLDWDYGLGPDTEIVEECEFYLTCFNCCPGHAPQGKVMAEKHHHFDERSMMTKKRLEELGQLPYNWMIEWLPDDPENPTVQHCMIGTREDAEKESEKRHPGYLCKEIVFHRRGKANVKSEPPPKAVGSSES